MTHKAFLIGDGQIHRIVGERGETTPCPEARFKRGDVVKVRRNQAVGHFPPELIVLVAMKRVGSRTIKYILCRENHPTEYHCIERDLLPSGKEPVEIGTVNAET